MENILHEQEKNGLENTVSIVGVTKTQPPQTIILGIKAGLTNIGENRVQEASKKFNKIEFSEKTTKHLIGHLQSNKVKKAVSLFDRIDSVDSNKLAIKINNAASQIQKTIPVLIEINTSCEKEKQGFLVSEIDEVLQCMENKNLIVEGLMTVGPNTKHKETTRKSFKSLRELFLKINKQLPSGYPALKTLSMGMSRDYLIGVKEGSTMVRIGTAIFGARSIK